MNALENKYDQIMENTKNTYKRNKTDVERYDGVKLRPKISHQNSHENTNSKLLTLNADGNELRISKHTPKRVSFLDDEGQLAISLIPPSEANEEQIWPDALRTRSTEACKSHRTKKQLLIFLSIIFVILALIIVVIVVIKEIQQVLQRKEPEKLRTKGKLNHSVLRDIIFFFENIINIGRKPYCREQIFLYRSTTPYTYACALKRDVPKARTCYPRYI